MIGIVVSRADAASVHVGEHLLEGADWEATGADADTAGVAAAYRTAGFELREFADLHLELENVADAFSEPPDVVVFASRHAGETGPLLTAHFTGNFGAAEHGGADRDLAAACPNAHKRVLAAFDDHAPAAYEVGMECTHHGPTDVGAPSMFVELGSDEAQWEDPAAAEAVANAILDLRGVEATHDRTLVAFGGGHYAPRPTRLVTETDWRLGHVAADWCLDDLGTPDAHRDVVEAVFAESEADHAIVDGDRQALRAVIEDLGHRVVSETWAREVQDVPLALADELEVVLSPVDDGLRFGDVARGESASDFDGEAVPVVDLPDDLLAEAHGIDPEATRDAVAEIAVAYETEEGGNRIQGRGAFADQRDYDEVVDRLVTVLGRQYDAVRREDGRVIAEEAAFDPEKAATLGVPEGPKFGKLAAGEAVTVDGERVPPEAVRSERTRRFAV